MAVSKKEALAQIDSALADWSDARGQSQYEDLSDLQDSVGARVSARLAATIDRLAPPGSQHKRNLLHCTEAHGTKCQTIAPLVGMLKALKQDYDLGYVRSFEELVHADTFSGFLEMADHLHGNGYKDAATVIAGSTLEQHLRSLATKNSIAVEIGGKFKKAEALNSELATATAYSKLDQKNVTSWLGLRNDAAHGNYNNYSVAQTRLLIDAVSDFIARNPA